MKYTAAIIGTGKIAGLYDRSYGSGGIFTHAKAYLRSKNIRLVAACDIDKKRLNKFSKIWGVQAKYLDVKDFLANNKVDIISLCTPSPTHFQLLKTILQHDNRPRIVFIEKPVCCTKGELVKLKKLLRNINTKLVVNHKYRYNLRLQKAISMKKDGRFGNLIFIRAVYYGGTINNAVHIVDILRMIRDSGFRIIRAKIGASGRPDDPCIDAELSFSDSSSPKIILESCEENYYQLFEMELRFEKGRIRIMDFARDIFIDKVITNDFREKELKAVDKIIFRKEPPPFINLLNKITAYLDNNGNTLHEASIEEAGKTMMILWKLRESAFNKAERFRTK